MKTVVRTHSNMLFLRIGEVNVPSNIVDFKILWQAKTYKIQIHVMFYQNIIYYYKLVNLVLFQYLGTS